jgi:DNA processing protein
VPGHIFSAKSHGTHRLIRNGAALVGSADDLLEALNLHAAQAQQELHEATPPDDPTEAALLRHLSAEPQHVDTIVRACGLAAPAVAAALTMLELKGWVRQVGPMEYVRDR